jgi:tRNA1(Val) A37 N6-methylase TrmN6
LARREPGVTIAGLELQPALADLARQNVALNGFTDRMRIETGDLLRPPATVAPGSFDLVLANPPFHVAGRATAPKETGRATGHVEGEADLAAWIEHGLGFARPGGVLLMIHKPERLGNILDAVAGRAGAIVVFPLLAGAGKPASRILVRAEKGSDARTSCHPGLVLHESDGRYTDAAEAILRRGEALIF